MNQGVSKYMDECMLLSATGFIFCYCFCLLLIQFLFFLPGLLFNYNFKNYNFKIYNPFSINSPESMPKFSQLPFNSSPTYSFAFLKFLLRTNDIYLFFLLFFSFLFLPSPREISCSQEVQNKGFQLASSYFLSYDSGSQIPSIFVAPPSLLCSSPTSSQKRRQKLGGSSVEFLWSWPKSLTLLFLSHSIG